MRAEKRLLALCLAVMMMILTASCSSPDWVMELDGNKIVPGVYLFSMVNGYYDAKDKVTTAKEDERAAEESQADADAIARGESIPEYEITYTPDIVIKNLFKEKVGDQPAGEYITDLATKEMKRILVIDQQFAQLGLSLTESDLSNIAQYVTYLYDQQADHYTQNGIARTSVERYATSSYKASAVMFHTYRDDGDQAIPLAEKQKYFGENYTVSRFVVFAKINSQGEPLEGPAVAAAKAQADEYLRRAKEGENFYQLIYENQVAQLGASNVALTVEVAEQTLAYDMVIRNDSTSYTSTFLAALQGMAYNTPTLVEDDYYYYVVSRQDPAASPNYIQTESVKRDIVGGLRSDTFDALCDQWAAEANIVVNDAAISFYKPQKLKMETSTAA